MDFTSFEELGTDIAELHVGPDKKLYKIHQQLLCKKSDFFKALFERWEGKTGPAALPEDDPVIVGVILTWMYKDKAKDLLHGESLELLTEVYALAGQYLIPDLQDEVMDKILTTSEYNWDTAILRRVLCSVQSRSGLYKYAVERLAKLYTQDATQIRTTCDIVQESGCMLEFLRKVRSCLFIPYTLPDTSKKCYYHEHSRSSACNNPRTRSRKRRERKGRVRLEKQREEQSKLAIVIDE